MMSAEKENEDARIFKRIAELRAGGVEPEVINLTEVDKEHVNLFAKANDYTAYLSVHGFVEGSTFVVDVDKYWTGFDNGRSEGNIHLGASSGPNSFERELTTRAIQDGKEHSLPFRGRINIGPGLRSATVVFVFEFDQFGGDPKGTGFYEFRW